MIHLTIEDDVAEVVLDAPGRLNALGPDDLAELETAYADAEGHGVRALLLRGEGRAFCAGRDISGVDPRTDDVLGYLGDLVGPLLRRMSAFPAPTFAVAHGACLGVGLGLLIATEPSTSRARHVPQTPPAHANGTSARTRSAALRMDSCASTGLSTVVD